MSFSEAINKAKVAETAVDGKAPNSRASPSSPPKTQSPVPVASQRGNGTTAASALASASAEDEDEDEDEDVTLRIPGSFDLENYDDDDDGGLAAGTDAVSVLGDLWRRMQLR